MKKYPNKLTYYKKENTGVADTRNFGIDHSKGNYLLFVDSDDEIEFDLLTQMEKQMNDGIEVIKFKLKKVDINGKILEKVDGPIFGKVSGEEAFNLLVFKDILLDSPVVYIFKKDLFTRNNFKFRIGTEHEDFGLIPKVIVKAETVISKKVYGYNYIQSSNSIMRNNSYEKLIKKLDDSIIHYDDMIKFINTENLDKLTKDNMKIYYTNAIILKLKDLKKKDRKNYVKEIRKRKMIKNVQVRNLKQLIKRIILQLNIEVYLKLVNKKII